MISLVLCMCLCQPVLSSSGLTQSTNSIMVSNPGSVTSLTLKVSSISPQDGTVLTNFPANLEIKVTRGSFPEPGARVQFWMMGGTHDAAMHNAFLTMTDSSGYAHLTLLNKNTLDPGSYVWYATATKPGFRGAASDTISFIIPTDTKGTLASAGTITTDKIEYSVSGNGNVVIHGTVNNYHMGQPIILKIKLPSGKTAQLVEYGTFLGAFQSVYKLGKNSELGSYTVTVYHSYVESSSSKFHTVK